MSDDGGDLFDMAKDGTTVPEDAAKPRIIPSKPRPDQIASEPDPNTFGGSNLADAADNAHDIPRTVRDRGGQDILTGTGDTLPAYTDSKHLDPVPGGVIQDPYAKGSSRYEKHHQRQSEFETAASDGPQVDTAPGDEGLPDDEAMDRVERKVDP